MSKNLIDLENLDIKAIIGLGNPGPKFDNTRHNIGFAVLDYIAGNNSWLDSKNLEYCEILISDKKILLIKPQTFMNDSGDVAPFLAKRGIKPENILVVHDDLEVDFEKLKIKNGGSARGHNGIRSIISTMGQNFLRLRFGIGRPEHKKDVHNFVLARFTSSELKTLEESLYQESYLKIIEYI